MTWWDHWAPIMFDGIGGALIGTVGAVLTAVIVVRHQSRSDRAQYRRELRTTTAIQVAAELNRASRDLKAAPAKPLSPTDLKAQIRAVSDRLNDLGPSLAYMSMSLYLEVAELAGELRLSVSDAALSDADDPSTLPEEWEHVARSTAWKLGVVYRDMQAIATPDSVAEFWEKQTNQPPPGRDAAPKTRPARLLPAKAATR